MKKIFADKQRVSLMSQPTQGGPFRTPPEAPPMPLATARERIVAAITPIGKVERIALDRALHRVLAETVTAPIDVPGAANSSMDGYAFAMPGAPHGRLSLRPIGESFAGHPYAGPIGPGDCVRIMTGAVVPTGVDTVVMQENTRADGSAIVIEPVPARGSNIRPAGEDFTRGDTVLRAGHYLRPADIAVLASVGVPEVAVYRRPRVAFFSTGDELRPIDAAIAPGEIHDSNRYGLAALLAELGMDAIDLGAIADTPAALRAAFDSAAQADAVVTSGGVSVGAADYVLDVLGQRGRVDFWRVAIKPGKPLAFGRLGAAYFFGLPGNPVSTAVTFLQLVQPALVRLAGGVAAAPVRFALPTLTRLDKKPGREHFLRARLQASAGETGVRAIEHQGSGVMRSMSAADCFIVLSAASRGAAAGDPVTIEPFAQPVWGRPAD